MELSGEAGGPAPQWIAGRSRAEGNEFEVRDLAIGEVACRHHLGSVEAGGCRESGLGRQHRVEGLNDLLATILGGALSGDPLAYVRRVRSGEVPLSSHASSIALNMARGVPTEIDELTGFVVRKGRRLGTALPACRTVYRPVKGMELARARGAAYGPPVPPPPKEHT